MRKKNTKRGRWDIRVSEQIDEIAAKMIDKRDFRTLSQYIKWLVVSDFSRKTKENRKR